MLLSRLPIPHSPATAETTPHAHALRKALPLLSFSLSNVARETKFFEDTAEKHGLALHTGPLDPLLGKYEALTKSYVDFLIATAAGGSLEEGLVVLWAMEKVCIVSFSQR